MTFSPFARYNPAEVVTLALDTTTPAGSVAVARDGRVLLARRGDPARPHGERLPGDVVSILEEAGVPLGDVDLFAVVAGPGAFTGLRIGIACIQGLAFAHGRPAVGIAALDALAQAAWSMGGLAPGDRVAAWMDAARQEVFTALYELTAERVAPGLAPVRAIDPPSVGSADACLDRWRSTLGQPPRVFVGDGALRYRTTILERLPSSRIVEEPPPLAEAMVPLAVDASRRGLAGAPHAIRPLYVRRPDAEIARDVRAATGGSNG